MSVNTDDVIDIAPEFDTEDADALARIERFIARAEARLSEDFYGDLYDEAVTYLTAHLLTMSGRGSSGGGSASAGPVISEKVGDLARSYGTTAASSSSDSDSLSSTSYGAELLRLRKSVLMTPMIST